MSVTVERNAKCWDGIMPVTAFELVLNIACMGKNCMHGEHVMLLRL